MAAMAGGHSIRGAETGLWQAGAIPWRIGSEARCSSGRGATPSTEMPRHSEAWVKLNWQPKLRPLCLSAPVASRAKMRRQFVDPHCQQLFGGLGSCKARVP